MKTQYNPTEIEQEAQQFWNTQHSFAAIKNPKQTKFYSLCMLPYPSGELHMGHVRNYMIGDVIARYQRMQGKNVLQPMGWDAFGLPAENAALKNKTAPSTWTYNNINHMRTQLQSLGLAIDWQREVTTCKPDYYRWEQWLFLQMFKKGLAYKKNAVVNWDPVDHTVLANEQVVDGRGWRSGALIERREIPQWFLKITAYADQLLDDLEKLSGWPDQVRTMQRNWIGRSQGLEIQFAVADSTDILTIFTTRPDTLMGVTYLAIAAEHPLAQAAAKQNPAIAAFIEKFRHTKVSEADMATVPKEGIATPFFAIHPITSEKLPIWIANFVLMEYGSGAVMSVPAHDQRDFEFAQQYQLPLKQVIHPQDNSPWDFTKAAFTEAGVLINSGQFDKLTSAKAFDAIADYLASQHKAQRKINYRLRDWGISRQRYWGTPIPIIYCEKCGAVPVPEKDLPVLLPENITLENPQSPLKAMPSFYETTCPQCGAKAKRETDTFDTFMESSWYYLRYCSPNENKAILNSDEVNYWMAVDQYIGGVEHAVMHLLYARFINKVLRDLGIVQNDEPFINLLTQGMVLKDGTKMSKSKGNVVTPTPLIEKYGADTVRLFSIFAAPPELSLEWSDSGVEGANRFLKRIWNYAAQAELFIKQENNFSWQQASDAVKDIRRQSFEILQQINFDMQRLQFNTVVSGAMKIFNLLPAATTTAQDEQALIREMFGILLRLLAPITPHLAHYLWRELNYGENILQASWPEVDKQALQTSSIEMVVQVNGKLRGKIIVPTEASQEQIQTLALENENVQRALEGKPHKKVIVVPKKLVNVVV